MPILESIQGVTPASLFMIYFFLPLLLVLFYCVPRLWRKPLLVFASMVYGLLVQPLWVPLLLFVVGISYGICYLLQRRILSNRLRKFLMGMGIVVTLGTFAFAGAIVQLMTVPLLLGATVYPIIALQGMVMAYHNQLPSQNFWQYALECFFFPKLYGGPFTNFKEKTLRQVDSIQLSVPLLCSSGGVFVRGAFKAKILGGMILAVYHQIKVFSAIEVSILSSWTYVISFALAIYCILSGYLDMAKGVGGLFGIAYPEGFFFPYQADTMTAFSRRFHTTWHRVVYTQVYRPMKRKNDSRLVDSLLLLVAGMTFGIWFGFTFNYAIWGGFIGLFLLLEKHVYPNFSKKVPLFFRRSYVIILVLFSFPILTEVSVANSLQLYGNLFAWFGGRLPLLNNKILYIITSNWLLLLLGGLIGVNVGQRLLSWLKKTAPKVVAVLTPLIDLALLFLLTTLLV